MSFEEFLQKDKSFTVHHLDIQQLVIETFMFSNNIAETAIGDLLGRLNHSYNLRAKSTFIILRVQTVSKGQNRTTETGTIGYRLKYYIG